MFILIFGLTYISSTKKIMTKKTYAQPYTIKQVWVEDTIILIKDVQKWVHEKLLNNPMKISVGSL
jgi:hypothetical protein